jgi:hypothetical protein
MAGSFNNRSTSSGVELKVFTNPIVSSGFNSISNGVSYLALDTLIVAGSDSNQRIGRSIRILWVDISGSLVGGQTNSVADDDYNFVRISLQGLQGGLVWSSATYNVSSVLDPRNRPGLDHVYHDAYYTLVTPGKDSVGYINSVAAVRLHWNVNRVFTYTATTGGCNSPHELFLSMCSDSVGVPNPGFTNGSVCIYYTDA